LASLLPAVTIFLFGTRLHRHGPAFARREENVLIIVVIGASYYHYCAHTDTHGRSGHQSAPWPTIGDNESAGLSLLQFGQDRQEGDDGVGHHLVLVVLQTPNQSHTQRQPRSCVVRNDAARFEYLELHDFLAEDPIAWFHPIRRQQQLSFGGRGDESQ
jgi:hypothetical protein